MANYALIDIQTTSIVNIVVWDGITLWNPGEEYDKVLIPEECKVEIGGTYVNGEFIALPEAIIETTEEESIVSANT